MSPTQIEVGVPRKPEPDKSGEETKEGFNFFQFLKEVRAEFPKISWPPREQIINEFFAVIILVVFITGVIFVIDKVFDVMINLITGRLFL